MHLLRLSQALAVLEMFYRLHLVQPGMSPYKHQAESKARSLCLGR